MKTAPKIILPLLLIVTGLFASAAPVSAQSAFGASAIPSRLEVTVKPGDTVNQELKIRNDSSVTRTFDVSVKDFIVSDDIGTPVQIEGIDETANRWAASTWVQASPDKVTLKPGELKTVSLIVNVPNKATAGGHYAMVLYTPSNGVVSIDGSGAAITTRVGTLLYITVPGLIKEQAQIKEFSAPHFQEYGPIPFRTVITNLSDVHILPLGNITVSDMLGLKVASVALPENRIFPLTDRVINTLLNKKWLFGYFTAHLSASYGTKGQVLASTINFWVIPWRLLILLAATLLIFVVLLNLVSKKAQNQLVSSEEKVDELERELDELKKKYRDRK